MYAHLFNVELFVVLNYNVWNKCKIFTFIKIYHASRVVEYSLLHKIVHFEITFQSNS